MNYIILRGDMVMLKSDDHIYQCDYDRKKRICARNNYVHA